MEETFIKCDYCEKCLNTKDYYIELREKRKELIIDRRYHFCDRHCLISYLQRSKENE